MVEFFNEVTGKKILLKGEVKRIVSLSPAITEILFKIGAGKKVVAVSAFCKRPSKVEDLPAVGSYNHANLNKIKLLNPDIIFTTTGYQRELTFKLTEQFNVFTIPLPTDIFGILSMINMVSLVTDDVTASSLLRGRLFKLLDFLHNIHKNEKIYVELSLGGPVTFGEYSYITDSLTFLGYTNIYGHIKQGWLVPDFDHVKQVDPDVIVYEHRWNEIYTKKMAESLIRERNWEDLTAYKNGRFYVTPGKFDFIAHYGPSFISKAMIWLSKL